MNLNKAFILGNLTKDPNRRSLPSGQPVVSFGVATNRFYTDRNGQKQQETVFHNIVAFGKLAEIASNYLKKGSLVLIEGRIKNRSWEDQSGMKRQRTEIIAEALQLGPRNGQGFTPSSSKSNAGNVKTVPEEEIPVIEEGEDLPSPSKEEIEKAGDKQEEINIEDIPF